MPKNFRNGFNGYTISKSNSGSKGSSAYMARKVFIYLTEISYFTQIRVEFLNGIAWQEFNPFALISANVLTP